VKVATDLTVVAVLRMHGAMPPLLHMVLCLLKQFYQIITLIFAEYNQQDVTFLNLFIAVRRCTCFGQFFRPLSGAQNYTYSIRYLSDQYCYLLLAVQASRQELKTARTASGICQTNTATCC